MTSPVASAPPSTLVPPGAPRTRGGETGSSASAGTLDLRNLARADVVVPIAVLGILMAMVAPLPPFLIDLLISTNITISTVILLVSMYIRKPSEFTVFPTTLLLMTLFRLALNVSSSRLILLNGSRGTSAAGEVIESFGNFVVGGNFVIGVVIFLVLIAIQYVVINHGAVRISEVTARFTLDALPGKQMSIDADLNAGLINEAEAKARRKALASEAEFYGAMDGASRFTQRDAVASILITAINIFAGFLIGVLQHGMELAQALETYTVLTIGDGLVTVIPALMISISGGLIVTRAGSEREIGADVEKQLFEHWQPLVLSGGVLFAMALFPGLPKIPFLALASAVSYAGWRVRRRTLEKLHAVPAVEPQPAKESLESLLKVEPLAIEVGLGLVRLAEGGSQSPLIRRISGIRRQLASELGYVMPPVRVTDNLSLKAREYVILLRGVELSRYELVQGCELAIPQPGAKPPKQAVPAREPAFGLNAFWVPSSMAAEVRAAGFTVVDSVSVVGTHLSELIRRNCHEIFNRQETKRLLDRVGEENPKAVEDVVPKLIPMATVQRVLQNLLRERVSIRDGAAIIESLGEAAALTRNPILLTEFVRQSLRRMLVKPFLSASGELPVYFLDPALERAVEQAVEHGEQSSHLNLSPDRVSELIESLRAVAAQQQTGLVLLTGSGGRYFVRQLVESQFPQVSVLSHGEVPPGTKVVSLGVLKGNK
jgi:flagellar biosynthesis protein FlhA